MMISIEFLKKKILVQKHIILHKKDHIIHVLTLSQFSTFFFSENNIQ
jgi:hypothetical protein